MDRCTDRQRAVLKLLDNGHSGPLRLADITEQVNGKKSTIHRDLVQLSEYGLVEHVAGYRRKLEITPGVIARFIDYVMTHEPDAPQTTEFLNDAAILRIVNHDLQQRVHVATHGAWLPRIRANPDGVGL